jgi:hypothetical protein
VRFGNVCPHEGVSYGDWKTKLDEKLIGFWFNMEDRINVMIMVQDCMAPIEFDIKALDSMWSLEEKVNFGFYNFLSYEFFKVGLYLLNSIV